MPITINGSGTVTGISAGGLPDGVITTDDIAASAITRAKMGYAGAILQVVQATITTQTVFNSSTYQDATDFNASISPSSSSSKVLVIMTPHVFLDNYNAGSTEIGGKIVRGSTDIFEVQLISGYGGVQIHPVSIIYLDSPATTSSTTYKLQVKASSTYNNSRINLSTGTYATKSLITLMEVSA